MIKTILQEIQVWIWKRKYRPGKTVTQFVARDVRRDVEVIDTTEISNAIITGRIRTWNVLYARYSQKKTSFGDIQQLEIKSLWDWNGEYWGGSVPESTDENEV